MSYVFDRADLRIDTYTDSTPWLGMKILHVPTGNVVHGMTTRENPSRHWLRERLLEELKAMLPEAGHD